MLRRLWDKGDSADDAILRFTVGDDTRLDLALVRWDVIGSAAHVRMLASVGLLAEAERDQFLKVLKKLLEQSDREEFRIPQELEDCHTAIENFLTQELGDMGGRVHTGRSRNDQVLLALRLFMRAEIIDMVEKLSVLTKAFLSRMNDIGDIQIPGYSHLQRAMPSSVGLWLHAFAEHTTELMRDGVQLLESLNYNPLGAGAGFGVSLPLDRRFVAEILGFFGYQRSVIDVQNSRGRYELKLLRWCSDISSLVEKIAWDMILYTTSEFGFFALPSAFTTGSSIMPQKRNPDVLELLRARAGVVRGAEDEMRWLTAKLPSNYHRDFQLTKSPLLRAIPVVEDQVEILSRVIAEFSVCTERTSEAMSDELFATYDAFRQVQEGVPFRDAYRETAQKVKDGTLDVKSLGDDFKGIQESMKRHLPELERDFKELCEEIDGWRNLVQDVQKTVLG